MTLQCDENGNLLCHDDGTLMAECCCEKGCGDSFDIDWNRQNVALQTSSIWKPLLCGGCMITGEYPNFQYQCADSTYKGTGTSFLGCTDEYTYDPSQDCFPCDCGSALSSSHPCYNAQFPDIPYCKEVWSECHGCIYPTGWLSPSDFWEVGNIGLHCFDEYHHCLSAGFDHNDVNPTAEITGVGNSGSGRGLVFSEGLFCYACDFNITFNKSVHIGMYNRYTGKLPTKDLHYQWMMGWINDTQVYRRSKYKGDCLQFDEDNYNVDCEGSTWLPWDPETMEPNPEPMPDPWMLPYNGYVETCPQDVPIRIRALGFSDIRLVETQQFGISNDVRIWLNSTQDYRYWLDDLRFKVTSNL